MTVRVVPGSTGHLRQRAEIAPSSRALTSAGVRRASEIAGLAAEVSGRPRARIDAEDLLGSAGLEGRAASRFLQLYAMRFRVDMRGYRWWFHHRDHGVLAMPLVALDGERREIRLPLSAAMLAGFAERGRWDLEYPPHRLGLRSAWWAVVVFGIVALGLAYAIAL